MNTYFQELGRAMRMLGEDPSTIFIGQGCGVHGTGMRGTFDGIPDEQRIEFPVAEDLQMGMSIGMALAGYLPVCVFPRWNFVLCAANQLVNHLDRLPIYSNGGYNPKVLIRVAVPSKSPFNPQSQHDDDFTVAFSNMLRTVKIVRIRTPESVVMHYREAVARPQSTILVEFSTLYSTPLQGVSSDASQTKECAA